MPPIIEVTSEVLEKLDQLKILYSNKAENSDLSGFIYVPSTKLHISRQKTHFGKNWRDSHENGMQTPLEFVEFLKHVKINNPDVYNEITQVGNPWRAERIDAYFEERKDGMYVLTGNRVRVEKLDEDTLMENKRISLDSWLENPTNQGLPRKDVKKGNLYFYHPTNDAVARVGAVDDVAYLGCDGGLDNGFSSLGVRAVVRRV